MLSAIIYVVLLFAQTAITVSQMKRYPPTLFGHSCDSELGTKITKCGLELSALGVFSDEAQPAINLTQMSKISRDFFIETCRAYSRYNFCLGGTYIKEACYQSEPFKSRYAVTDSVLDYVCLEGYESMVQHWDCYLSVAASQEIAVCQMAFMRVAATSEKMYNDYTPKTGACFALQTYLDCIRPSIEMSCGLAAFDTVLQAIERPVHVYLPFCPISNSNTIISIVPLMIALLFQL